MAWPTIDTGHAHQPLTVRLTLLWDGNVCMVLRSHIQLRINTRNSFDITSIAPRLLVLCRYDPLHSKDCRNLGFSIESRRRQLSLRVG